MKKTPLWRGQHRIQIIIIIIIMKFFLTIVAKQKQTFDSHSHDMLQ